MTEPTDPPNDPPGEYPQEDNLGEVAEASLTVPGMPSTDATQEPLEGTDYTVLSFLGMKYTKLEDVPKIGDLLRFEVEVVVVGDGNELMANGTVRHIVKVKPTAIVLLDDEGTATDGPEQAPTF